ncbi:MAG: hypothetical protein DBY32_09350 [Phascolarctobacterium sp.]|nr:MAG: hypothetical protein DBY32_09350 [Phascolarctobacterium sp.]
MVTRRRKRYYWLKLDEDFFNSKQIKKLRKLAGGDTFAIIYLKMLLLSINNDCLISYDGVENSFEEELALQLDEGVDNVKVTVMYLKAQGLLEQIELDGTKYSLPYASKNVGSEAESTERVRRMRERKKLLLEAQKKESYLNATETKKLSTALQCNENVTSGSECVTVDNLPLQCNANETHNENSLQCNTKSLQSNDLLQCNADVTQYNESVMLDKDKNKNNKYISSITNESVDNFKVFVEEYPKKINNFELTKNQWNFLIKSGVPSTDILSATRKYKYKVFLEHTDWKYIKNSENFLRDGTWIDYLPLALDCCDICKGSGYEYINNADMTVMKPCRCTQRKDFYKSLMQAQERRA